MSYNAILKSTTYSIVFVRHGESEGNVKQFFQGQVDYPLTDLGRNQAKLLSQKWIQDGIQFDQVISSPLSRAFETAQILSTALKIPLRSDSVWMEQDFGELSNISIPEYRNSPQRPAFFTPYQSVGKTGESRNSLLARASQAVESLIFQKPGCYLVVSHGSFLNMVMYVILGMSLHPDIQGPRFRFGNTSFASTIYDPEIHRWHLLEFNNQSHLLHTGK